MADTPTRPYCPRNGSEGRGFMARFCDRCKRDAAFRAGTGDSCEIVANAMCYLYPPEWVENDADGADANPRCTAFDAEMPR
jgi:hypothetical protein